MLNDYSDKKKAEVDEAYQRYQEEQEQKEVEKQEADAAQGKDKIFSMKMTEEFENWELKIESLELEYRDAVAV